MDKISIVVVIKLKNTNSVGLILEGVKYQLFYSFDLHET